MSPTTILYPYCAQFAAGDELRLSLRSVGKFLKQDYEVCIIGDVPEWYTGASIPMPRMTMRQYRALTGQRFNDRWHPILDVLWKYCAAAQCPHVSEQFVVMWDDTFLTADVDVDYLLTPRYLDEIPRIPPRRNDFWDMMGRTRDRLLKKSLPILDFATHHPFPLEKSYLPHYCAAFDAFVHPGSTHTQYHNWRRTPCERINHEDFTYFNSTACESFTGRLPTSRIINIATVTPAIESTLRGMFSEPSPWERMPVMAEA